VPNISTSPRLLCELRGVLITQRTRGARSHVQAGMRHMVVIAVIAERIAAAFRAAVRANRGSTVRAFRNGGFATANGCVRAVYKFDLTARGLHLQLRKEC
jgi:hypothetical protein